MRKNLIYSLAALIGLTTVSALALTSTSTGPKGPARVDEAENIYTPNEVSDLKIVWNVETGGFDFSFVAPTRGYYYDWNTWDNVYGDLTSIDRIVVQIYNGWNEDPTVLKVFENPTPGEALSFSDNTSFEKGKRYDFQVYVYVGDHDEYTMVNSVLAGALPAAPTNLKVETTQGQLPVMVSFTAPSTYKDSEAQLASLVKATLEWSDGGWWSSYETIATLTDVEPGKEHTFVVNDLSATGTVKFRVTVYGEDGASDQVEISSYIGIDTPGAVTNLKAVEQADGNVLLTWEAPVAGANGGYFDPSALTYNVKVTNTTTNVTTTLATEQTGLSYTYNTTAEEPESLNFSVTAVSAKGAGAETKSGSVIVGPAMSLPFFEGFDNQISTYTITYDHLWGNSTTFEGSYPPSWYTGTYAYVGNVQVKPEGEQGGLIYISPYSSTPASEFYLTSAKINVAGEAAVELSYSFYAPDAVCGKHALRSEISFDNGATFIPVINSVFDQVATKGWNHVAEVVEVPSGATTAILRMVAINDPENVSAVVFDAISLKSAEAPAVIYPASVSDFTAAYNRDERCIDVTMTAPTRTHAGLGDVRDQELTNITCIKLLRQIGYGNDYILVHTFENPAPGEQLTYKDTDLTQYGEYCYRALVYVNDRCDYGEYTEPITIGQIPADVTEVKASSTLGSAPVVVSFRAPEKAQNGDPLESIVSIVVRRYNSDTFVWDEIGAVSDNVVPGQVYSVTDPNVVAGNIYEYRVVAYGTAGNSYGVTTSVYVGLDNPVAPANVIAQIGDDGQVVVTWDAPTAGLNGGYIDTDHLTYIVQRGNSYSDYDATLIATGVTGTTFTDPTKFEDEEIVKYFVKAVSGGYESYSGMSNNLLVGNPSPIPYLESFEKVVGGLIQADHGSWSITSSESSPVWAFAELAYFIYEGQVQPVEGGHGLAYAYYGPYSSNERDDYLTSGNIDVTSTPEPWLSFYVYGVPGYETVLSVNVAFDNEGFETVKTLNYVTDFETEGWQKVSLPVTRPAGAKTMKLQFHAHKGAYSCSVAIDKIRVDSKQSGIAGVEAVSGVMVASVDGSVVVTGAKADSQVVIADLSGRVVYTGNGDCKVPVATGVYVVSVDKTAVKLRVR